MKKIYYLSLLLFLLPLCLKANSPSFKLDNKGGFVDQKSGKPALFFGFNYCVPFAHGFRMTERLGLDHKEQILTDITHMARMGVNAFRVHVWDCEISDEKGNLLHNDHLDLLDYTIATMAQHGIYTTLTAMALGGNGYPEPNDNSLPGFSIKGSKDRATYDPRLIEAQKTYLAQLILHKNPYTNSSYVDDPWVVALEINNEPEQYDLDKADSVTMYINQMCRVVKKSGWKKPILYNVAQCSEQIEAYMKTPIDGVTFQWYPSGLVANKSRTENFLPAVSHYDIPFAGVKGMANKVRWVYEFDAADIPGSYIYPAMARSLRTAGFQWATQFAYDPLAIANINTDYQTHYINLIYTPAKAISFSIAASAFHNLPSGVDYGPYPASNKFGDFVVDYHQDLSLLNSDTTFAYSNTTNARPVSPKSLKHIAGHGSSPVVSYDGTGAYFLDQKQPNVWLMEIYPDVILVADPHGKSSPRRPVAYIQNNLRKIRIDLQNELGYDFEVIALSNPSSATEASDGVFEAMPGAYILKKKGTPTPQNIYCSYRPAKDNLTQTEVIHHAAKRATIGRELLIEAQVASPHQIEKVTLAYWNQEVEMQHKDGFSYQAVIEPTKVEAILDYHIVVQTKQGTTVWPEKFEGTIRSWDFADQKPYTTYFVSAQEPLVIYNAQADPRQGVEVIGRYSRRNPQQSTISWRGLNLAPGAQYFKITPQEQLTDAYDVINIKSSGSSLATITLIDQDGLMWMAKTSGSSDQDIPLSDFVAEQFAPVVAAFPLFSTLKPRVDQDMQAHWSKGKISAIMIKGEQPTTINQITLKKQ